MRQTDRNVVTAGSIGRTAGRTDRRAQEVVAIAQAVGADTGGEAGDHSADEYEYCPLRIDSSTSRASAAVMLAVRAEFTGWELAHVLRYSDGSRRVTLRRRRSARTLPALSQ